MNRDHTPRSPSITLACGMATAAGNRRADNQDVAGFHRYLAVVADGIGGRHGGRQAASIAVDTLIGHERRLADADQLRALVGSAHLAVRRAATGSLDGMGTTVAGVAATATSLTVFHVGDSRCYRLAGGRLELVTSDHSVVQELVLAGRLDAGAAASHPMGNVLTRAIGIDPTVQVDTRDLAGARCRLLLCSDGLSSELPARTLGRVLAGVAAPQRAAQRLVELALAGIARDNVTALVVDVDIDPTLDRVVDPSAAAARQGARS